MQADGDMTWTGRVANGVIDQVVERLTEQKTLTLNVNRLIGSLKTEIDPFVQRDMNPFLKMFFCEVG